MSSLLSHLEIICAIIEELRLMLKILEVLRVTSLGVDALRCLVPSNLLHFNYLVLELDRA
jgi:hypothetical protein